VRISSYKFIIVLALGFFSNRAQAQLQIPAVSPQQLTYRAVSDSVRFQPQLKVISKDQYVRGLAFFCKQEWKFEKTTGIPVRFRVGSLDQCNFLEGK